MAYALVLTPAENLHWAYYTFLPCAFHRHLVRSQSGVQSSTLSNLEPLLMDLGPKLILSAITNHCLDRLN
jgi:hypothetical protein